MIRRSAARSASVVSVPSCFMRRPVMARSRPRRSRPASIATEASFIASASAHAVRRASWPLCAFLPLPCRSLRRLFQRPQCRVSGFVPFAVRGADRLAARSYWLASRIAVSSEPPWKRSRSTPLDLAALLCSRVPRRDIAGRRHRERARGPGGRERRLHARLRPRPHPQERQAGLGAAPIRPARLRGRGLGRRFDRPRRRRAGRARPVPGRQDHLPGRRPGRCCRRTG